ncbi:MAG: serine acetyltransferase [Eubacterium sp.]|nr:serine acetyltransferase [Eubacterium sp.]
MVQILAQESQEIIKDILDSYKKDITINTLKDVFTEIDKDVIICLIQKLFKIVFPGYFRDKTYKVYDLKNHYAMLIEDAMYNLRKQILLGLSFGMSEDARKDAQLEKEAQYLTAEFFRRLPEIREYVEMDVQAAFDGDPSASSRDVIIFAFPGNLAITIYRMAHVLFELGVPLIPRIMTEYAHNRTGIDIHPGATIGKRFFIDHGTGIVIGETTVIGDDVKVYQGVTLGALSTRGGQKLRDVKRHPTIEDGVTIYSGASILGGETVIGKDSIIGGNVFITRSIPAGTTVSVKNQELIYKNEKGQRIMSEELDQDESWFYVI